MVAFEPEDLLGLDFVDDNFEWKFRTRSETSSRQVVLCQRKRVLTFDVIFGYFTFIAILNKSSYLVSSISIAGLGVFTLPNS
jgi:hypothetical protein